MHDQLRPTPEIVEGQHAYMNAWHDALALRGILFFATRDIQRANCTTVIKASVPFGDFPEELRSLASKVYSNAPPVMDHYTFLTVISSGTLTIRHSSTWMNFDIGSATYGLD